jgi:hypothetical protein
MKRQRDRGTTGKRKSNVFAKNFYIQSRILKIIYLRAFITAVKFEI